MRKINSIVFVSGLLLSACATNNLPTANGDPRIELPQQFRMAQETLLSRLERKVGKIAVVDERGNILVMDQSGGATTKITRDANLPVANAITASATSTRPQNNSTNSKSSLFYSLPVWSPDAKQIAFVETVTDRPLNSTLIELNPASVTVERSEGSQSRQFVNGQAQSNSQQNLEPRITEDNPSRVIIERGDSAKLLSNALYIASADGAKPLSEIYASTADQVAYIDWSPDGAQLAFLNDHGERGVGINLISAQSGQKAREIINGSNATWHWNPDGKSIIAKVDTVRTSVRSALASINPENDNRASIVNGARLAYQSPQYSPDGGFMLTASEPSDGKSDLLLADRAGNAVKKLTSFVGRLNYAWSPAGVQIAYITRESPSATGGALHLLNANTGEDRVLSQMPVSAFFWSPDGQRIAIFSFLRTQDISPDFPGINLLAEDASIPFMLAMIDINSRTARQLFYFEPTESLLRVISEFDRFNRSINFWSPDSKKFVLPVAYGPGNYIIETEATGSINPRVITRGTMAVWSPK